MKKFVLGLCLGLSVPAAMAASNWYIPLREAAIPDGTVIGSVGIVKTGIRIKIASAVMVMTWDEISIAKALADERPE